MATGRQDFDERGVKTCEAVRNLDDCNGTDVPGSDLSDNERETSDNDVNDNFFGLNVVNVSIFQSVREDFLDSRSSDGPIHPENPSSVKSGDANAPLLNFKSVHDLTPSDNPNKAERTNEGGPVLREHWKPCGLLSVGRSRLGFPDCDNDHLVQLLVCKNQHTREVLDIGGHYDVTVAVRYDEANRSSLKLPDYQCERIKSKTKSGTNASMIGVIGYLFRFHEPHTKYTMIFSLNAIPTKRRGKTRSLNEHTTCETICKISLTLETGPTMPSKSGKVKKKAKEITVSPLPVLSPPSFSKESNVLYKRSWWVVNQLCSCRKNAQWKDFDELASDLWLKFTDADTQITIKLEQGRKLHYQNQPDRALQLIDDAFNFMSEAENPQLMAGRSYFYKAEILRRQGSLGEAEYCVNLAGQNIAACETGLDTGLIAWERARILTDFMEQTPHRSLKLVNAAQSNLEKCIDFCLHVETETSNLHVKQFFVIVLLGMTILLLDCDSDVGRKRSVPKEFIAKAKWCLDTLRNKYWSEMTLFDRVYFYMSSSDLEYRRSNYKESEEFARLAKDKVVEMGLNTEASQKRLDFLRVITSGQTIDNGPQQSESEGENADISSSEADSDWLTAILN